MRNGMISGLPVMTGLAVILSVQCAAAAPTVTAQVHEVREQDIEASLLEVKAQCDSPEITERVNDGLAESIYEGQLDILDFLRECTEDGVTYGPYTHQASLAGAWASGKVLSVLVSGEYYSGGVHGWHEYFGANFDLRSGELLEFEDILDDDADREELTGLIYDAWCEVPAVYEIEAYSAEDIYEKAERTLESIDEDNWRAWNLDGDGLRLRFIAGTETAYASGPAELLISYRDLEGILDPDYLPETENAWQELFVERTESGSGDWNEVSGGSGSAGNINEQGSADWGSMQGNAGSADWGSMQGDAGSADWGSIENQGTWNWDASTGGITAGALQGGHHYEFIQTDMTWEKANADALSRGGYLAVITSSQEQSLIEELMKSYPSVHTVWIGGQKGYNGQFSWVSNEAFEWTKWGVGEPNNETGDENYLDMYTTGGTWVWNDVPNSISQYYAGKMGYILELEGAAH